MMFLTPSELEALTGCKRPADQIKWLSDPQNGFTVKVRRDGTPAVLREHVRQVMGLKSARKSAPVAPDFSWMQDAG